MRKYAAEFLATFFLVFAVAGAAVADHQLAVVQVRDSFGPLGVALAYGLAFAAALAAIARISGGFANPAVTLALFVTGRMNAKDLMGFVGSQLAGGLAGGFLVKRLFVAQADQAGVGAPALGEQLTSFQGIAIEIVLTFLLVLVIWGVAVDRNGGRSFAPLIIGFALATVALIGAPFTGGAVNPARWFGSAAAAGQMDDWPVWIVGPAIGALLAALLYESVLLPGEPEAEIADAEQDETSEPDEARTEVAEGALTGSAGLPASEGSGAESASGPTTSPGRSAVHAGASQPPEPSSGQPGGPSQAAPRASETETSPPPPPPPPGPQPGSEAQKTPEQNSAPGPGSSEGERA